MTRHTKNIGELTDPEVALAYSRSPCTVTYFEGCRFLPAGGREAVILHLGRGSGWTADIDRCEEMTAAEAQELVDKLTAKRDPLSPGMFAVTLI